MSYEHRRKAGPVTFFDATIAISINREEATRRDDIGKLQTAVELRISGFRLPDTFPK